MWAGWRHGGDWYGRGSCHFLTLDCRSVGLACIAIGFPVLSTDRLQTVRPAQALHSRAQRREHSTSVLGRACTGAVALDDDAPAAPLGLGLGRAELTHSSSSSSDPSNGRYLTTAKSKRLDWSASLTLQRPSRRCIAAWLGGRHSSGLRLGTTRWQTVGYGFMHVLLIKYPF